jgi:hypothetical protein
MGDRTCGKEVWDIYVGEGETCGEMSGSVVRRAARDVRERRALETFRRICEP